MKRIVMPALACAALLIQGCNSLGGQPQFVETGINPNQLKPGDEALITVKLKDKHQVVQGIEGVVQEDQRITFDLNDRGEQADAAAGDNVWTFGVKVPFQAPEGQFMLDLTAYRSDGNPVPVRDKEGNVTALQSTVPLVISVNAAAAPAIQEAVPEAEPEPEKKSKKKKKSEGPESIDNAPAQETSAVEAPVTEAPAEEAPAEEAPVVEESAAPAPAEEAPAEEPVAEEAPKRSAKSIMGPRSKKSEEAAPAEEAPAEEAPAEEAPSAEPVQEAQPVEEAAPIE